MQRRRRGSRIYHRATSLLNSSRYAGVRQAASGDRTNYPSRRPPQTAGLPPAELLLMLMPLAFTGALIDVSDDNEMDRKAETGPKLHPDDYEPPAAKVGVIDRHIV